MPGMSAIESAFCRSSPWRSFARTVVLPWALAGRPLSGEVLEIGAGSGAMASGVAAAYPTARLTVTDVDPAMVEAARTRLASHGNVTSVQTASVSALPFDDASFDGVTSFLMLHHVVDWEAAVVEVRRVLKPGAAFLGYDLTDTVTARLVHRADRSPHRLISPPGLAGRLSEVGFVKVTVQASVRGHLMRFAAAAPGPAT